MQVQVDNIWATTANLHLRVTVWADDRRWRHRYDVAVPVQDISDDAIAALYLGVYDEKWREDVNDIPLF